MHRGLQPLCAVLENAWRVVEAPRHALPAAFVEAQKTWRRLLALPRSGRAGANRQCSFSITDRRNLRRRHPGAF